MLRLAIVYFLVFAMVGVYAPWIPPLLEDHGLPAAFIGLSLSVVAICRTFLPPLWGIVADRARSKGLILAVTAALSGVTMLALLGRLPLGMTVACLLVFGFFFVPVVPLLETLTLGFLGEHRERYGSIRLWGSLGFIATSLGLGIVVRYTGIGIVPVAAALPLLIAAVVAWRIPESPAPPPIAWRPAIRSLPWRRLAWVLTAATLGQASHGPYYAYFTLRLADRGESTVVIGALWAWGVLVEIGLMAVSPRFLPRIGLNTALRWALILSAVRWTLFAFDPPLLFIAIGQTLHAASFGLLHLTAVQLVDELTPTHSRAFGQMVLSATAYGVGIGGGLAVAGLMIGSLGLPSLFAIGAGVCLVGYGAAVIASRKHDD